MNRLDAATRLLIDAQAASDSKTARILQSFALEVLAALAPETIQKITESGEPFRIPFNALRLAVTRQLVTAKLTMNEDGPELVFERSTP